ncbi:MAG TPA: HD domain-containing protein [Candidatus Binatia bacterium]
MIFAAIEFAARAHSGQFRKGTNIPYIVHPLGVAKILLEYGCAEAVVAAGMLHDTVEDTPVALDDIRRSFGDEVAALVEGASEPDKSDTWENRKRHTIEYLKTAPVDVLLIALADKLDNLRSMRADYERLGDAFWSRFNRPMESQRWYYRSLAELFSGRRAPEPLGALARELTAEVERLFGPG